MMKKILFIVSAALSLSCKNIGDKKVQTLNQQRDSGIKKSNEITPSINLNMPYDTNNISFTFSTMSFKLNYYKNRPQYLVVDDERLGQSKEMGHYQIANKGLYTSFNIDSNTLAAFGAKYVNGNGGIDVVLKQNNFGIKSLNIWSDYTNEGAKYDFSKIRQGKITVYDYRNGEIIDSFILHK